MRNFITSIFFSASFSIPPTRKLPISRQLFGDNFLKWTHLGTDLLNICYDNGGYRVAYFKIHISIKTRFLLMLIGNNNFLIRICISSITALSLSDNRAIHSSLRIASPKTLGLRFISVYRIDINDAFFNTRDKILTL